MNTAVHKAHDVQASSICISFLCCLLDFILFTCLSNFEVPGMIYFPEQKNYVSDHYLALQTCEEHHSLLVFCTSFKFDRHNARSRPLLLALIFLACLLTLKFEALTVSHLDVRDHECDAKTGQYWTLCSNLQ